MRSKRSKIEAGVLGPLGGYFWASEDEIAQIMLEAEGKIWNYRFSLGDIDPWYCMGQYRLQISKFESAQPTENYPRRKYRIEGVICFPDERGGPRLFRGSSEEDFDSFNRDGDGEGKKSLCHSFRFTDNKEGGLFHDGPSAE